MQKIPGSDSIGCLDVMSKQELIAELMHTLCGGLKSLHAGSFQNVAAFKRHANSWYVSICFQLVLF